MKRHGRGRVLGLALALPIVFLLNGSADPLQAESGWRVEVVEPAARLRAAPDTGSAVLAMLHRGDVLEVRSWSPAVWAVAMSDVDRYFAPAFWIRAIDSLGQEGWIASPLVLPVNAWPKEPWSLGQIEPTCSGGRLEPLVGKAYVDLIEIFENGLPVHRPSSDSENREVWEAFVTKVSRGKWVQVLRQSGGYHWLEAQGGGVTCEPCMEGLGRGPAFDLAVRPERVSLAVVRDRFPDKYQELPSAGVQMPFFFTVDQEHLFALLAELQPFTGIDVAGVTDLVCSPPLPLWEASTQKANGLWDCSFSARGTPWRLLFGIEWSNGKPSPWLVRFAAQTRYEPRNAEFLEERRATLGADVQTSLDDWFVSDLNDDRTLELWLRTHVETNDYGNPGWEIYFLREGEAIGPWFVLGSGGGECD